MGSYRTREGAIVELPDEYARGLGYEPVAAPELEQEAIASGQEERRRSMGGGLLGGYRAAALGALSGASLGATDALVGAVSTPAERERYGAENEAHPLARLYGETAGAIGGAASGVGPAGLVSRGVAPLLERGGLAALTGMGLEGSAYATGQYLGHAALEDKEVSAEGLAATAGLGFGFGAVTGAAMSGVARGTIAARNMFSKVMDGEEAAAAAGRQWGRVSEDVLAANERTAQAAREELAALRSEREAAEREVLRQQTIRQAEAMRAQRVPETRFEGERSTNPNITPEGASSSMPERFGAAEQYNVPGDIQGPPRPPAPEAPAPVEFTRRPGDRYNQIVPRDQATVGDTVAARVPREPTPVERANTELVPSKPKAAESTKVLPRGQAAERPSFADAVNEAASKATKFGDRKAYIASVFEHMPPDLRGESLDTFKTKLLSEFQGGNKVNLARADLVQAMNPELLAASTLKHPAGAEFHFVEAKPAVEAPRAVVDGEGTVVARPSKGPSPREVELAEAIERADHATAAAKPHLAPEEGPYEGFLKKYGPGEELRPPGWAERLSGAQPATVEDMGGLAAIHERVSKGISNAEARMGILKMNGREGTAVLHEPNAWEPAIGTPEGVGTVAGKRAAGTPPGGGTPPAPESMALVRSPRARLEEIDARVGEIEGELRRSDITPGHRQALRDEMNRLHAEEAHLSGEKPAGDIEDIGRGAERVNQYEKSAADLADLMGDKADPLAAEHAKLYRDAENAANQRMNERVAQAVDDAHDFGPQEMSAKERVAYAKERAAEAKARLGGLKIDERAAAARAKDAAQTASKASRADAKAARAEAKAAKTAGGLNRVADLGSALEWADEFHVKGLPKPHDIPIVGPLLGAWLKFRAVKRGLDKLSGRVPATGNVRAASAVAKAKDKIASSVDAALSRTAETAKAIQRPAAAAVAIATQRIFDDGGPTPPKDASLREHIAARVRELAAYASNPGAIERDVRREMQDVSDPDLIKAAIQHRVSMIQYLNGVAPVMPPPDPLGQPKPWSPTGSDAYSMARRLAVANDPEVAFNAMHRGELTVDMSETLRNTFPQLYRLAQQRLLVMAGQAEKPADFRTRAMLSLMFDRPLDQSLNPVNIRIVQDNFTVASPTMGPTVPAGPTPLSTAPPVPSVAGDVMINKMYQPGLDGRVLGR